MESCSQGEVLIGNFLCIPDNPSGFATEFYGIGLSIIGGLALIYLIYGAYVLMISRGNPGDVRKGRSYIFYAIAALLLAIFGYVFIEVVFIDILHIPGFSR
jgi:glucose uptake protein GlcU